MGSSGSGKISDYPGSSGSSTSKKSSGDGGNKGEPPEDRCAKSFNTTLEDVEQSEYFQKHKVAPPIGTPLEVVFQKRLVARVPEGEIVGNLPTLLNYLAACIKGGWTYLGKIQSVTNKGPVIKIAADFAAVPPK